MFLFSINFCDKLDRLNISFFWSVQEGINKFLCLRAWANICVPKLAGGMRIRRARDVNVAYIMKLGWSLCTNLNKTWVKLIRSKYLRGRRIIDFQRTSKASSWIWHGIKSCKNSLDKGMCHKVVLNSFYEL